MDWMQILREFGVPTLYAVIMLIYFFREQNFIQKEVKDKITDMQAQMKKNDVIICNIASDVDVIASTCQTLTDQGSAQAEKLRDLFTYFITRKGGSNGNDNNGTK